MKIWVVLREDDGCDRVAEAARLTKEEADAYVTEMELQAMERHEGGHYWYAEEVDMPLSPESPRIMAEAVTP